jgi:RHS repeat-associated protein
VEYAATGNVIKSIIYDSFGNIIQDSAPTVWIPIGFAGGLIDQDTGLVHFGFREYSPEIGRWAAKDPILFWGGDTDLYGYCLNDPINWIDPWGLCVQAVRAGEVTRAGWENPNDHTQGFGWRVYITAADGTSDIYAHMDPNTTPEVGEQIAAGACVGEYANPTNGHSTGPHLHYERRDANGNPINPGNVNPIPGGRITTPYRQVDPLHPGGHNGIDFVQ